MKCPYCHLSSSSRPSFLVHVSECRKGYRENYEETSSTPDNTDEDPSWSPEKKPKDDSDTSSQKSLEWPPDSPVTNEQEMVANAVTKIFDDQTYQPMEFSEDVIYDAPSSNTSEEHRIEKTSLEQHVSTFVDPAQQLPENRSILDRPTLKSQDNKQDVNVTPMEKKRAEPNCYCGIQTIKAKVTRDCEEKGKYFLTCQKPPQERCHFFEWLETSVKADATAEPKGSGHQSSQGRAANESVSLSETFQPSIPSASIDEQQITHPAKNKLKKYFCLYCRTMVSHFARHLISKHKNEQEVISFASLPTTSKERKDAISKLRGKGSNIFNSDYELNKGELQLARRRKKDVQETDMKPCVNCLNYYYKGSLWKHYKLCTGKESAPRDLQRMSESVKIKTAYTLDSIPENLRDILAGMEHGPVHSYITTDSALLDYGVFLCTRNKETHQKNLVRSRLRELAKVAMAMKELNTEIKNMDDAIIPQNYDIFVKAVNIVARYDGSNYGAPSLVNELGRSMKGLANRRIIYHIKHNDDLKKAEAEKWLHIYNHDFYNTVGRNALRSLKKKRWRKTELVPLTEDILILNKYLSEQIKLSEDTLKHSNDKEAFTTMNKCLMAQIQIFNRKRRGELQNFEIADFEKRHNIQKGSVFYKTLKQSERLAAEQYMRVETRGKLHLKPVSMLLTVKQVELIKLILSVRKEFGVHEDNNYVFAYKGTSFRAYNALRDSAYASGAKNPELLVGTLLRKEIATTAQILNFSENEMTNLAAFLGHDLSTHRQFYRLPNEAVHLAKISRLLVAMDEGKIDQYKGKSLEEIDVNIPVGTSNDNDSDSEVEEQADAVLPSIEDVSSNASSLTNQRAIPTIRRAPKTPPKKTHTTKNKRHTWRTPERHRLRNIFHKFIFGNTDRLPTPLECRNAIRDNKELRGLSVGQIKGWIFSERRRKQKEEEYF